MHFEAFCSRTCRSLATCWHLHLSTFQSSKCFCPPHLRQAQQCSNSFTTFTTSEYMNMIGVPLSEVQGVPVKFLQSAPNRSESEYTLDISMGLSLTLLSPETLGLSIQYICWWYSSTGQKNKSTYDCRSFSDTFTPAQSGSDTAHCL